MRVKKQIEQSIIVIFILALPLRTAQAQTSSPASTKDNPVSKVWVADRGDGTYKNPIIHADYSDPDAVRVNEDFYMVSSSFNATLS